MSGVAGGFDDNLDYKLDDVNSNLTDINAAQKDGTQKTQVVDSAINVINPATEEKQDDTITELVDANTGLDAIELNQTDGTQKTQIVGTTGTTAEVNDDGQLHAVLRGKCDDDNSTTTPLVADASFVGTAIDTLDYSALSIVLHTDQESADNGFEIEYSHNGTDWHDGESYTIEAGATKFFTPTIQARYLRVSYTNGGTDQTDFHMHTVLRKSPIKWSSHNINDNLNDDDDGELNVSVLKLRASKDNYVSAASTNSGNFKVSLEEFESDISENSNTSLRTTLVDGSNNIIDSHQDADGGYHSGVSLIQSIITSTNNSTTTNLAAGATFTGTADETFGINGIQVFHASNENCTVYIDQCIDTDFNANDTITDSFPCYADVPCSRTFVSAAPYYRLRVKNNGLSTTSTLATYTGMTPIINPLPRALSDDGRLETETTITGRTNTERHAWINPTNEQAVSPVYRMVGTNFDGDTQDPNFWTELVDAGTDGSVTQSGGEIELKTSATATGWAKYTSKRKGRFVAGSAMLFSGGFNFKTAGTTDNIRRCGAYTTTDTVNTPVDGFYFELNGTTFSVNSRFEGGTVSSVASGSFNGTLGASWTPTADTYYKLEIEYTPLAALFYVNSQLLHKKQGAHQTGFLTLPITMENIYTSGAVDVNFETVGMYIARQGELITNGTYHYVNGAETTVLKYGAGVLQRIIVTSTANADLVVYDGLSAVAGTEITAIDAAKTSGTLEYNVPFSTGLYIDSDAGFVATLIYE